MIIVSNSTNRLISFSINYIRSRTCSVTAVRILEQAPLSVSSKLCAWLCAMDVDENCPLLLPQSEGHEPYPQSNDSRKPGSSPSKSLSITVALFGKQSGLHDGENQGWWIDLQGVFLASADEQLVMATYGPIASEFENLSDGSWLLTGYNLGYCIALPLVCHTFLLIPPALNWVGTGQDSVRWQDVFTVWENKRLLWL